jgi:type III restriction enzyme
VFRLVFPPRPDGDDLTAGAVALTMQEYEAAAEQAREDGRCTVLQRVPGAPRITFPRRERKVVLVQFSLSEVTDREARAAGAAFASEIAVPLVREAINVRRTAEGGMHVEIETLAPEIATQEWLPVTQVQRHLQTRILRFAEVMQTRPEANAAQRIAEAFLVGAGVSARHDVNWSAARSRQAEEGLHALVQRKIKTHRPPPQYEVRPVQVPAETRPMSIDVIDRHTPFERHRWYSGWTRSILCAARFDAETTEFALAWIMDGSPAVRWWLRLQKEDQAFIELDDGSRYYPDFIAVDTDGVSWIIEGKRDRDADAPGTQAKKTAAESHLRHVSDFSAHGTWRYLFCTETAIRRSRGSWDALVAAAGGLL